MAIAQATLVQRVRRILLDTPWAISFTQNLGLTGTAITFPDATRWNEGAIIEWQDNGEQAWVSSVTGATTGTIIRGWNNTTPIAHNGSATAIIAYKNPLFKFADILESVSLTVQELIPYAWKKETVTITPTTGTPAWYDVASDAVGLISVTQVDTTQTPIKLWSYGDRGSGLPVGFRMNLPTSLVASTNGILFPRGFAETTDNIQVDYAAWLTDTVTGGNYTDISEGLLADAVAYGAAARLIEARDVPRTTQQDIGMQDASVQPGMISRLAQQTIWAKFQIHKNNYFEFLRRTIPIMYGAAGPQGRQNTARGSAYTANAPY